MRLPVLAVASLLAIACQGASPAPTASAAPAGSPAPVVAGPNKPVDVTVTDEGFSPSTIEVKKGDNLVLRFTRKTKSECLKAIKIPDQDIKADLPIDKTVDVPVKTDKEGTIAFMCWMGMVTGKIVVKS